MQTLGPETTGGTRQPRAALVVNLTRFGDLLQSQPMIEDLHQQGYTVHLACLDNFSGALPLLRHVVRAWPLPGARLMADLNADWRTAAARLLAFAQAVRAVVRPACVVNLTTTLPARLLTGLLAGNEAELRGFCLDADGFGRNKGIWATFLNSGASNRLSAPFNLVDMFRMVGTPATIDMPPQPLPRLAVPPATALEAADALLASAPPNARGFVAMQLGASEQRRQWPAGFFAAVGDRLWHERGLCPVLLGSAGEIPLAEAYAQAAQGPWVDAVGKTDLAQLAALLHRARLLLTNDTGTMHLAAGLGIPCLAIFLATAQPCDTGPYLPGCCCLEPALPCHPCPFGRPCPNNLACVAHISPQSVGDLALAKLDTGRWEAAPMEDVGREARVWLTEQDDRGFAAVRCLTAHAADDRSLWLTRQRAFWRQILDDLSGTEKKDDRQATASAEARRNAASAGANADAAFTPGNTDAPFTEAFTQRVGGVLEQATQLLDIITKQGALLGRAPMAGQLFLRNCERLQAVLDACPELRSLGAFWRELRQEHGEDLNDLLAITCRLGAHLGDWKEKFKNGTSFA